MFSTLRELDHRTNDGIDVQMLWDQDSDRVLVTVSDFKTGDAFTLTVAPHQRAYDLFHHPYAYAPESAGPPAHGDLTTAGS